MDKKNIWHNTLIALTALVPALICLLFINSNAVNIPFLDEWELVPAYAKMKAHSLTLADLFAQQNEHKIFFTRLVYFGLMSISNYNVTAPMWGAFVMILLMNVVVLHYIATRSGISGRRKYFFATITSFILFSLAQYENLLWGIVAIQNSELFTLLSFYFLYRTWQENQSARRNLYVALALTAAVISSLLGIQGLITWITGSLLMLLIWQKKSFKTPVFYLWNIIATLIWVFYFYDYTKPGHHPPLTYLFEHPGTFVNCFLATVGNAISGNFKDGNAVIGLLLILFFVIACVKIWKSKQVRQFSFPLALALNSLFISGSIAVGRAGFGVEQVQASRYVSFSICLAVGVALMWMELKDKAKNKTTIKNITKALAAILLMSIPLTITEGFQNGKKIKIDRTYSTYILETANSQPDHFLQRIYPWPDTVRIRVHYLQQQHLNVFHRPQYAVPELLFNDSLDTANNEVLQFAQNTLQFAPDFMVVVRPVVHPKYKNDVKALYADIDGQVFPLYYKPEFNNRPPNPASIYDISAISNRVLTKGIHTIKFKALRNNSAGYYLINPGWRFEVK
jgi:hypothetical protein